MSRFAVGLPGDRAPGPGARNLHQFVVDHLGRRIADGDLPDGARIWPEELAEELGASRPVVREALRVLEAKGMVRPRPKTGTRVLPMNQWNLLDRDVISWRTMGPGREQQLSELTDLRIAVEIYAARLSALRATPEQVAALHEACDRMAETGPAGDVVAFTAADVAFHTVMLEASGNAVFGQFAEPFAAFLHARVSLHTLPAQVDDQVIADHRTIVAAIEAADGQAAESAARTLIEQARAELDSYLRELS